MIYLASQSPRRAELLNQIKIQFEILLPTCLKSAEELEALHPNEAPANYVARVTELKLKSAIRQIQEKQLPAKPILCADTTVSLNGEIYGKPDNENHARQILQNLSDKQHSVMTCVAIYDPAEKTIHKVTNHSKVTFTKLSEKQIEHYIKSGQWQGKAGAYGIQGEAATFISEIQGSYSSIMGLPLYETTELLKKIQNK